MSRKRVTVSEIRAELDKIHTAIDVQDFSTVFKDIENFEKHGPLSDEKRLGLAEIRERLYQYHDGLRVVWPELDSEEMASVDPFKLILQMRLAHLLNLIGAKYVAQRILNNLELTLGQRNIDGQKLYWAYIYIQIYFCRTNYLFNKLLFLMEKYDKELVPGTWYDGLCNMHKATALHYKNRSTEAIRILERLLKNKPSYAPHIIGLIHRTMCEIYIDLSQYSLANDCLSKAHDIFKDNQFTREKLLFFLTKGTLLFHEKKYESSKEIFINALKILDGEYTNPRDILYVLAKLCLLKDFYLLLPYRVAICAHKSFRFHAFSLGKRFCSGTDFLDSMPLWFKENNSDNDFDSWIIINNQIFACRYSDLEYKYLLSTKYRIIDLYAGLTVEKEREEITVYSELQSNCLATVIGCGGIGINQWSLYDNTYRHVRINDVGLERIKDLVKSLKKKGISIIRRNNFYYYQFKKDEVIILYMQDLNVQGLEHFARHLFKNFTRKDLENKFSIKKTTAVNWIKEWSEKGLLDSGRDGKEVVYSFKSVYR